MVRTLILALVSAALLDSPRITTRGGPLAIKPPHILVTFGIVLVISATWETVRCSGRQSSEWRHRQYQHGALVVAIVCAYVTTLEATKASCDTFHNALGVPQVGDHIIVVGSLAEDHGHHS